MGVLTEILAKYGLWLLIFFGGVALVVGWLSNTYDDIYDKGAQAERVKWQQKEAQEQSARNNKIKEAMETVRQIELAYANRFAKIEAEHAKEIKDGDLQKQRDIAAARAGALKLRWNSEQPKDRPGGNATSNSTGTAGVSNGATKSELPAEITANLYELADDADQNTEQLTACQSVINEYRQFRCTPDKETKP